jgi:hypothetical protein
MTATISTPPTAVSTTRTSTTRTDTPRTDTPRTSTRRALIRTTAVATLLAAVATELLVALVNAAGRDVAIDGTALGFGGCASVLLVCMVPAVAVIAGVRRWSAHPARAWVRITVALTVVSLVPDLAVASTSTGSRLTLMAAHLVAAAIVVPLVARTLATDR